LEAPWRRLSCTCFQMDRWSLASLFGDGKGGQLPPRIVRLGNLLRQATVRWRRLSPRFRGCRGRCLECGINLYLNATCGQSCQPRFWFWPVRTLSPIWNCHCQNVRLFDSCRDNCNGCLCESRNPPFKVVEEQYFASLFNPGNYGGNALGVAMWPGFGSALGVKAASSDQPWHLRYPAIRGPPCRHSHRHMQDDFFREQC